MANRPAPGVVIGVAAGVGALALLGIATAGIVTAVVLTGSSTVQALWSRSFDATQTDAIRSILGTMRAEGVPDGIALAAIANAYAESDLGNHMVGDDGKAVGLWQLHEDGAGRGMSVADRMAYGISTRRIIEVLNSADGAAVRGAYERGATVPRLAALWSRDIERPARERFEMLARRSYAAQFWPGIAELSASRVTATAA